MRNLQRFDCDHHSSMQHYGTDKRHQRMCVHISVTLEYCRLLLLACRPQSRITIALEIECSIGRPLQTQVSTIRPEGTSGLRETCCSKAKASKHCLGYYS